MKYEMIDIKIAISTNINFYKKTIPVILESILNSGVYKNMIHIFITGCNDTVTYIENDVTYHKMNHNNFEISSLIEICEKKILADYWFLIHDTCKVGHKFKQLLYNNIVNKYPIKVALTNKPSMSIGLYKYDYLLKIGDQLSALKNTDFSDENMQKVKEWAVKNEDLVMWDTLPTPNLPIDDHTMRFLRMENWYGGESKRKIEYFNGFDIFKSKSNWYWPTMGEKWVITL